MPMAMPGADTGTAFEEPAPRAVREGPRAGVRARGDLWEFGPFTLFGVGAPFSERAQRDRRRVGVRGPTPDHAGSAYGIAWLGSGSSRAFRIRRDALALPVDTVRRAGPNLPASPLYEVVRGHLAAVARDAERLGADPAAHALVAATIELVRALVVSAAGGVADGDGPGGMGSVRETFGASDATRAFDTCGRSDRHGPRDGVGLRDHTDPCDAVDGPRDAAAARIEALRARILAYAQAHLTERDLTPDRIARELHICVRSLYKVCKQTGLGLRKWIIDRRLEGAHRELASPGAGRRTIAAVARSWGFTDPSHFARRFRAAYGASPREVRDAAGSARFPGL